VIAALAGSFGRRLLCCLIGLLERLFGEAGQILHVTISAAEAKDFLVDVELLVEQAPRVDVELDRAALQALNELRLRLGSLIGVRTCVATAIVATPASTFSIDTAAASGLS